MAKRVPASGAEAAEYLPLSSPYLSGDQMVVPMPYRSNTGLNSDSTCNHVTKLMLMLMLLADKQWPVMLQVHKTWSTGKWSNHSPFALQTGCTRAAPLWGRSDLAGWPPHMPLRSRHRASGNVSRLKEQRSHIGFPGYSSRPGAHTSVICCAVHSEVPQ